MRHTMKDVEFYLDRVNNILTNNGSEYRYIATQSYGHKNLVLAYADTAKNGTGVVENVRGGLTTGQLYDLVYGIWSVLNRMTFEGIIH